MMRLPAKSQQHRNNNGFADKMEYQVVKIKRFVAAFLVAGTALGATAANMPPAVAITAPAAQAAFLAPATITLRANAADSDGTVASVSFYEGANLIGTVTSAPFTYQWSGAAVGSYSITAKVTDDLGAETTSAPQPVTIQAQTATTQVFYVYSDQIDTAREIINASGTKVWQTDTEPFGANLPNENPAGQGSFTYNPRFPGQYYDRETGLHYNYYRDYDPSTARYVQSDPIGLKGGINTYGYVLANPIGFIDPRGLDNPGMGPYGPHDRSYASHPALAQEALSHLGEYGWGKPGWRGGLGWISEFKCNLFNNQTTTASGATPPLVGGRGATAGELGNPNVSIPGWPVVTDGSVNDGDIVAIAHSGAGYSGHTGVVVTYNGAPYTVSANSHTGTITWNDWGFRPGQKPVVRRCDCAK